MTGTDGADGPIELVDATGATGDPSGHLIDVHVDRSEEGKAVYELRRSEHGLEVLLDEQSVLAANRRRNPAGLAELAIAPWEGRDDITVLLGGLGMGRTLRGVLDRPGVVKVDVVEMSATLADWNRRHFGEINGNALSDPRVTVHTAELGAFLREPLPDGQRRTGWFVLLIDTDVWPMQLARAENVDFYHDDGMLVAETALRPGGVLAMWAALKDDELEGRLRKRFQSVARIALPTEITDGPGFDYVYRGRRSGVGGGSG